MTPEVRIMQNTIDSLKLENARLMKQLRDKNEHIMKLVKYIAEKEMEKQ